MEEQLSKYSIIEAYPVHWGDMDAAKHVNNLIYLRWAESIRLSYFKAMGMDLSFSNAEADPIMGWQDCKYIFPVTHPDTIIAAARTIEVLDDRFFMEIAIFSKKHQRIVAISKQRIIPYSYNLSKKVRMPKSWVKAIEQIEKGK